MSSRKQTVQRPRQARLPGTGYEPKTSGSETRKTQARVTVRFTPDELAKVKAAASEAGCTSTGEYVRLRVFGQGQGRGAKLPQVDRVALVEAIAAMGRVGSNVNQIARAVNAGGTPGGASLRDMQAALAATLDAVRKSLGR